MTRPFLLAALATLAAACGGTRPPSSNVAPAAPEPLDDGGAVQVMVLARPTSGQVWLSLWIDAGTRDGAPGAAALAAAALRSETVHTRALPDGIELSRRCDADALPRCLDELAAAVSRRDIAEPALAHLRETRRRALASAARRADGLAMRALLGREVDPLLGPEASATEARRFLDEHAGAGRLLLVAVGDVARADVVERARDAFDGVPAAGSERAARAAFGSNVQVEVDRNNHAAVAIAQPSVARAAGLARRLLGRDRATTADVFALRGGAVALLRGEAAEPLVRAVRIALAESPDEGVVPAPDSAWSLARQRGVQWVTRGDEGSGETAIGVGAVLAGGRADDASSDDALRRTTVERLESAIAARAVSPDGPTIAGAQVQIHALPDAPDAAVVLRFRGGAAEEPPNQHGITWTLAGLAQSGCARVARDELGRPLGQLGMSVRSFVEPDAWGLAVSGPRERYRELIYLAVRCAEVPHRGRLEAAIAQGVADAEADAVSAAGARLLAPTCPGRVRPSGAAVAIGAIHRTALESWRERVGSRARLSAVFVGQVPRDRVAERFAQLLERLPEGGAAAAPACPGPTDAMRVLHRAAGISVLVGWDVATSSPSARIAAAAFAEAVAESLGREPGVTAHAQQAGAAAGRAWATVQLTLTEAALTALPQHVARALEGLAWSGFVEEQARRAREASAAAGASARGLAMRLAADRPTPAADLEVARALAAAMPRYVIAREQVGHR